jgi:type IV pilus assembly protein PilO
MSRTFKLAQLKEPRVAMRLIIGVLLAANIGMAIVAFKPFGGSADDLRKEADTLRNQLQATQARLAITKRLAQKVDTARTDGEAFLARYIVERRSASSAVYEELIHMAAESGVQAGQYSFQYDDVKGSDSIKMMTISAGFEGTYQQLTKLVSLIDKSQRFFVIDSMQTSAPQQTNQNPAQQQGAQRLNVQFKIKTFVRGAAEAES